MRRNVKDWLNETIGFSLRAEHIPPEAIKYVEEAWRLGAAAEREACADLAENVDPYDAVMGERIALAIRARSDNSN